MKKRYCPNYNIIKTVTAFKMALIAAILLISVCFNNAFGGVTITVPTLPAITGCSFPTAYSALGDIVITETAINDISTFGTLTLTAPANFEFLINTGSVSFAAGNDITSITSTSINTTTIIFTINGTAIINLDTITISGIQVRGITAAAGPQNVTRTAGTSVIDGDVNGTIHATFTSFLNSVTGGTIATAQTICSGGDPTILSFTSASTGSTLTYQWQSGTDGITFPANLGASTTYDPPTGLTTTTYYRCITTSTLNSVACTANSNVIIVTVDPVISNNTVTAAQTICSGSTPSPLTGSTPTGGNGSYTYLWESSVTSSTTGFAAAAGTNTSIGYTPGALTATTWYRRI